MVVNKESLMPHREEPRMASRDARNDATIHIRIAKAPQGRPGYSSRHYIRLGVQGVNYNLCGADYTDRDLPPHHARKSLRDPEWAPRICQECVRRMEA
jgi:hypothetical protein